MQAALNLALATALSSGGVFGFFAPPKGGPAKQGEKETTKQAEAEAGPEEGEATGEEAEGEPPAEGEEGAPAAEGDAPPEGEGEAEAPAPKKSAAPLVDPAEIARLQEEARSVRDELFKARARVSSVTSKLFRSKVVIELRSNVERFYEVEDFTITIDGAPVYFKEKGLAPVRGSIVEMYAAPGSHEMGVSARLTAKRNKMYQLTLAQTFTVVVPEDSALNTKFLVHELGNMFSKFEKRRRGAYRLHVELQAKAKANKKQKRKAAVTATGKASVGK
jgi:hypothetical protein